MAEIATKEQERKALEKIQSIVDGLGENSYIGSAFQGCFEVARDNIENDFGCSMLNRATIAEDTIREMQAEIAGLNAERERQDAEVNKLRKRLDDITNAIPTSEDINDMQALMLGLENEESEKARKAGEAIIQAADKPGSQEFQDAVRENRQAAARMKKYDRLYDILDNLLLSKNIIH